jgi:hypothetical protein
MKIITIYFYLVHIAFVHSAGNLDFRLPNSRTSFIFLQHCANFKLSTCSLVYRIYSSQNETWQLKWIQDHSNNRDSQLRIYKARFIKRKRMYTNHRNKVQLTLFIQPCIYNLLNMPWMAKLSIDIHENAGFFFFFFCRY